ncbi:DUF4349 domain-containing protein [Streptomyces diastatochromogenes]|uniref:DUF4349 domain-containing protein n=1 Tax=Streptomyces diastatochromogenes TaxID=42236 RepID=A0A233RXK5_STRDA|nr:DUF4349 domain-containing protein [Streptomyces diastatochromogenes]MCZ0986278.1 DUF4349 domain-containing protein [Streptomyces diastatochromogenes]OXY88131.1 hypothetical protein BEK98_42445 [Streptomyces diastatochromogenes]
MRTPRSARSARSVQVLAGVLLAASLALAGCSGANDSGDAKTAAGSAAQQPGAAGAKAEGAKSAPRAPKLTPGAIIRTASLTVEVKDVPKALDEARTTAESAGGYVGNETTSRDTEGHEQTRVVLRVPTEKYDEVLADLQGSGKLVDRTAKAEDVTDQVVDVDSRIKSQRASVARIRDLMDKATKLSDVVTLEGELSSREADLEALLAQQASLKDRTSLATITLALSETPVKKAAKDDTPGFVDALSGGWHVFVTMLRWIALALGAVLPFAALAALLALLWLRVVRPRLPRHAQPAPATTPVAPLPQARPVPDPSRAPDED